MACGREYQNLNTVEGGWRKNRKKRKKRERGAKAEEDEEEGMREEGGHKKW